jgi:hypothetical protein
MLIAMAIVGVVACGGITLAAKSASAKPLRPFKVGAHLQTRLAYGNEQTPPAPSFQARRVRLNGQWRQDGLRLALKVAFEEGRSRLMNAYATYSLNKQLSLRAGQFKRITNLDYLIGSYSQRIYERSIIGNKIDSQRDIGVALRGRWLSKRLDTNLAVFNGNGGGTEGNNNSDLRYEARIEAHLGKRVRYERRRIGNRPRAMLGAGFGYMRMDDGTKNADGTQLWTRATRQTMSGSVVLQAWRHELRAEWLKRAQDAIDPIAGAEAPAASLTHAERDGGYVQWAWSLPVSTLPFLTPVQASARAQLYRRTGAGGEHQMQYDVGGTWQLMKRAAKLSLHGWTRQSKTAGVAGKRAFGVLMQLQVRI